MLTRSLLAALLFVSITNYALSEIKFKLHRVDTVRSETCGVADFNRDGNPDIISGEYLYLAPDWKKIKIRDIKSDIDEKGMGYAWNFADCTIDVDGDGFIDVVCCDWFEAKSMWFRNPGKEQKLEDAGLWQEHLIEKNGNFETLDHWDITGRGTARDLFPAVQRTVWYEKTDKGYDVHVVSEQLLTFGNGVGDINGDGRPDLIRPEVWFEAPEDIRNGKWVEHPLGLLADESEMKIKDTAQIYVQDVNEDGLADIIATAAHDYGIFWYEQKRNGNEISWKKHLIDKSWSQVHAVQLADIDGDGKPELIAGKRFMAHNGGDPGEFEPLGIYWYKPKKEGDSVTWEKHIITYDEGFGSGMNIVAHDMDGDGDIDIVTTGKYGGPIWIENGLK